MTTILTLIALFLAWRVLTIPLRRKREKRLWSQWNDVQSRFEREYNLYFGKVWSVRQNAQTGSKVYMQWYGRSACDALWIWNATLKNGGTY